jgi:hypothetical protein
MMGNEIMQKKLIRSNWISIVILVLIYILGMYANLFVEIPEGAEAWQFAMKSGMLLSHIVLGTLLAFHAGSIIFMAIKAKSKMWITVSLIGFVGIILSIATGSSFVTMQTEMSSFLMAIGLGISILAYSSGMYLSSIKR